MKKIFEQQISNALSNSRTIQTEGEDISYYLREYKNKKIPKEELKEKIEELQEHLQSLKKRLIGIINILGAEKIYKKIQD